MIEFLKQQDYCKVTKLWNLVFGDTEEDILSYLNNYADSLVVFKENGNILGMTSLLPLNKGRYVYAVATHPDFRGRGIAAKLLDFSKDFIRKNNEDFLILVPAEESLFKFYENHNFSSIYCTSKKVVSSSELIKTNTSAIQISPEELFSLRKDYFSNRNFIEWDIRALHSIYNMYNQGFFKVSGGFAVCVKYKNTAYVKELCTDNIELSLSELHKIFSATEYIITLPVKSDIPNAMIFGAYPDDIYFNLAMD